MNSQQEDLGYYFQVGLHTYYTTDKKEIMYHKQGHEMKYKQSYLAYKMRIIWPLVDFLARYYNLMLNIAVIAFAIYSQISTFFLVCLFFFVL